MLAVPPDWFSNPGSLKESFRIASSLDWANIDLASYPGKETMQITFNPLND